jgi:hypothetical protein
LDEEKRDRQRLLERLRWLRTELRTAIEESAFRRVTRIGPEKRPPEAERPVSTDGDRS